MVRYLVVETGSWLFGRKVLLAAAAIGPVEHRARAITTALTTRQVKDSPGIDADQPVSRQHEEALHSYYDWPPYWYGTPRAWTCALLGRRRPSATAAGPTTRSSGRSPKWSASEATRICAAPAR